MKSTNNLGSHFFVMSVIVETRQTNSEDYYEILGVPRDATDDQFDRVLFEGRPEPLFAQCMYPQH